MSMPNSTSPGDGDRIVAIETSSRHGSVAVAQGARLLEMRTLPAGNRHATELMPAIRDLTAQHGWRPEQIDELYLSLGPGSFTGLRIAVAIARALHQAIGCRLVGVPTLDVIAENAPMSFAVVVPILDAKRGQVFSARYRRSAEGLSRLTEPALVEPAAFLAESAMLGGAVGVLGEGVEYHRAAIESAVAAHSGIQVIEKELWLPSAGTVYRVGRKLAGEGKYADPRSLLPTYIRLPEAEEVWRKKRGMAV